MDKETIIEIVKRYDSDGKNIIGINSVTSKIFFDKTMVKQDSDFIKDFLINSLNLADAQNITLRNFTQARRGENIFKIESYEDIQLLNRLVGLALITGVIENTSNLKYDVDALIEKDRKRQTIITETNQQKQERIVSLINLKLLDSVELTLNEEVRGKFYKSDITINEYKAMLVCWYEDKMKDKLSLIDIELFGTFMDTFFDLLFNYCALLENKNISPTDIHECLKTREGTEKLVLKLKLLDKKTCTEEKHRTTVGNVRKMFKARLKKQYLDRVVQSGPMPDSFNPTFKR